MACTCDVSTIVGYLNDVKDDFNTILTKINSKCPKQATAFDFVSWYNDGECKWSYETASQTSGPNICSYVKCQTPNSNQATQTDVYTTYSADYETGGTQEFTCDTECSHQHDAIKVLNEAIGSVNHSICEIVKDAKIKAETVNRIRDAIKNVAETIVNKNGNIDTCYGEGGPAQDDPDSCYKSYACNDIGIVFTTSMFDPNGIDCNCDTGECEGVDGDCLTRVNSGEWFSMKHFSELPTESAKLLLHQYCWCCDCGSSSSSRSSSSSSSRSSSSSKSSSSSSSSRSSSSSSSRSSSSSSSSKSSSSSSSSRSSSSSSSSKSSSSSSSSRSSSSSSSRSSSSSSSSKSSSSSSSSAGSSSSSSKSSSSSSSSKSSSSSSSSSSKSSSSSSSSTSSSSSSSSKSSSSSSSSTSSSSSSSSKSSSSSSSSRSSSSSSSTSSSSSSSSKSSSSSSSSAGSSSSSSKSSSSSSSSSRSSSSSSSRSSSSSSSSSSKSSSSSSSTSSSSSSSTSSSSSSSSNSSSSSSSSQSSSSSSSSKSSSSSSSKSRSSSSSSMCSLPGAASINITDEIWDPVCSYLSLSEGMVFSIDYSWQITITDTATGPNQCIWYSLLDADGGTTVQPTDTPLYFTADNGFSGDITITVTPNLPITCPTTSVNFSLLIKDYYAVYSGCDCGICYPDPWATTCGRKEQISDVAQYLNAGNSYNIGADWQPASSPAISGYVTDDPFGGTGLCDENQQFYIVIDAVNFLAVSSGICFGYTQTVGISKYRADAGTDPLNGIQFDIEYIKIDGGPNIYKESFSSVDGTQIAFGPIDSSDGSSHTITAYVDWYIPFRGSILDSDLFDFYSGWLCSTTSFNFNLVLPACSSSSSSSKSSSSSRSSSSSSATA